MTHSAREFHYQHASLHHGGRENYTWSGMLIPASVDNTLKLAADPSINGFLTTWDECGDGYSAPPEKVLHGCEGWGLGAGYDRGRGRERGWTL